jgi:hypothetical protein
VRASPVQEVKDVKELTAALTEARMHWESNNMSPPPFTKGRVREGVFTSFISFTASTNCFTA